MIRQLLFDETFADLIASGAKARTIRRMQGDLPVAGDRLELWQTHPSLRRQNLERRVEALGIERDALKWRLHVAQKQWLDKF